MGASPARSLLSRLCVLAIHATAVADATSDCFAIPDLLALYDSNSMYGCYFCRVDLGRAGLMRRAPAHDISPGFTLALSLVSSRASKVEAFIALNELDDRVMERLPCQISLQAVR